MKHQDLKISIVQTNLVWQNPESNLKNITEKIREISESTDLIVLPEMFTTGFSMQPEKFAESGKSKTLDWMQLMAEETGAFVMGSLIYSEADNFYNRLFVMQPSGEFASYDKRHLFSFAGEENHYTAGKSNITIDIKGWKIRPQICYDLRFPAWSRNQESSRYDILVYVANWPAVRSEPWSVLLKARAIENLAYVAGVNRVGADGNGIEHSGDSVVLDFKGNPMTDIKPYSEQIQTVSLSYSGLLEFRAKFPALYDADIFNLV